MENRSRELMDARLASEYSSVKKSKNKKAKELLESSQALISEADTQVEECKLVLSKATKYFNETKSRFTNTHFKETGELLRQVGSEFVTDVEYTDESSLALAEDAPESMVIKEISSGRFTAFLLGLLTALAVVGTWIYFAVKKLGINTENFSPQTIQTEGEPVLNWIGKLLLGASGDATIGAMVLGLSALSLGWLVYVLFVSLKSSKNLNKAKKSYEASKVYSSDRDGCKAKIEHIDIHFRELSHEIENFSMLLEEKGSVLKRIIYVEGKAEEEKEYHLNSTKVMVETERYMKTVEKLLTIPVLKDGKLNPESEQVLSIAKAVFDDFLGKAYTS